MNGFDEQDGDKAYREPLPYIPASACTCNCTCKPGRRRSARRNHGHVDDTPEMDVHITGNDYQRAAQTWQNEYVRQTKFSCIF